MRSTLVQLALVMVVLVQAGCSTSFRATGPRGNGVRTEVGLGARPTTIAVQESVFVPPPPPTVAPEAIR